MIMAAYNRGKWLALRGERPRDPSSVPILLALHLDEFGTSPRLIPLLRQTFRSISSKAAIKVAQGFIRFPNVKEDLKYLKIFRKKAGIGK